MVKVTVIGGGAWGTALACISVRAGHATTLWCRSQEQVSEISEHSRNSKYLGRLGLDSGISATNNILEATDGADLLLLSIPAQALNSVLKSIPSICKHSTLITTCKGIDRETGSLPSEVTARHFPNHDVAALSGPSFASDVVNGLPTAVTVASNSIEVADRVSAKLSTASFRCYANDDLAGVELGGSLKNVLALAVGAARGMGLGASAEAALIARGFAEVTRLATKLGGKPATLMGLSGLGDITLTCSTPQSRNFSFGMALGKGEDVSNLKLAEGAFTASVALQLANKNGVDVPITSAVVDVLENQITAQEAVQQLLTRPLKRET